MTLQGSFYRFGAYAMKTEILPFDSVKQNLLIPYDSFNRSHRYGIVLIIVKYPQYTLDVLKIRAVLEFAQRWVRKF
jgi:hypothetical protein